VMNRSTMNRTRTESSIIYFGELSFKIYPFLKK
jgi:hypothetical protein